MNNDLRTYLNKRISILPEWLADHLYRTAKLAMELAQYYKEDIHTIFNIIKNYYINLKQ